MTGGGVGNGLNYWATIRISGDLTAAQLQAVVANIETILNGAGVDGKIVTQARVSKENATETFQVTYRKP